MTTHQVTLRETSALTCELQLSKALAASLALSPGDRVSIRGAGFEVIGLATSATTLELSSEFDAISGELSLRKVAA